MMVMAAGAYGQRIPKPGFNLFSRDQDVQLGKEAAAEIEKTVRLVNDRNLSAYIEGIGRKLAAAPEASNYPYTFKVVHDDSINAFALPGGPTYVNTGLILAADNEAQLAGVMAHEISHVALRHGTNQASKANLIALPAMLAGSMAGNSILGQLTQLGIGLGANSVLLKFSRGAESDADLLGARMMAHAGYDPIQAAKFFEKLEAETGKRSGVEQWFSSHPNPGNRTKRIQQELPHLPKGPYTADTGRLANAQAMVKRLGPAPKPAPQATSGAAPGQATKPSGRFAEFRGKAFQFSHPDNWRTFGDANAASVTAAPEDGLVKGSDGNVSVGRGFIANFQEADRSRRIDLARETEALIQQLRSSNPTLKQGSGSRKVRVDGQAGLSTMLSSESPYRGATEADLLVTVSRPEGLYYFVFVAPQQEWSMFQPAFDKMLQSVRLSR
ncbi:MAG: M48 family metalloprotease [Bryobacteraceae bacterium]|nr:M48 family metalloprotease [Bryobacteraceae bacterium]